MAYFGGIFFCKYGGWGWSELFSANGNEWRKFRVVPRLHALHSLAPVLYLVGVDTRVFGEGVKSARGETAILGRGDHTRNMFGTSFHATYCKQTIALETAEIMQ